MLPAERQGKIRKWVQTEKTLGISEMSAYFQVSEMTIYRDIKPLIVEGFVSKTSGGISLAAHNEPQSPQQNKCVYCHKTIHSRMVYHLIRTNETVETACCAHCGLLRHRQLGDEVSHSICHDFLTDTTTSAASVWYVLDTSLNLGCCQPQVITIENRDHAEKFTSGFGGTVYGFRDAMETVYHEMHGDPDPACCNEDG